MCTYTPFLPYRHARYYFLLPQNKKTSSSASAPAVLLFLVAPCRMTSWLMPDGEFHCFDGDRASAIADYQRPAGGPSSDVAQEKIHGPAAGQAAANGLLSIGCAAPSGSGAADDYGSAGCGALAVQAHAPSWLAQCGELALLGWSPLVPAPPPIIVDGTNTTMVDVQQEPMIVAAGPRAARCSCGNLERSHAT